jgi:C4-type Zn-finger protein
VKLVVGMVTTLYGIYEKITDEVSKMWESAKKGYEAITQNESVADMIQDFEQGGFEFEKKAGWQPAAGAVRVMMLPSAE